MSLVAMRWKINLFICRQILTKMGHFEYFNNKKHFDIKHFSPDSVAQHLPVSPDVRLYFLICSKNTNFFICRSILANDTSFCRFQEKKKHWLETFFSKISIYPLNMTFCVHFHVNFDSHMWSGGIVNVNLTSSFIFSNH